MGEYRKTFVNRIYTVGLTTCGSALVRIAGATESEGFQKVASFVNKWICGGNNTGQTLAEIQALCNEILNEVIFPMTKIAYKVPIQGVNLVPAYWQ